MKNRKISLEQLKRIKKECSKIKSPETFSDLVREIDFYYNERETEAIFADIFYSQLFKDTNFFKNFPIEMVYISPNERNKERESMETKNVVQSNNFLSKLFSLKKTKTNSKTQSQMDSDNFF